MYRPDIRCPLEYGLDVFGGKWNSRIICVLTAKKTLRYSELRKELGNVTDAVLAAALKSLTENELVSRKIISRDTAEGRIFAYQKGTFGSPDVTEHMHMGGSIL